MDRGASFTFQSFAVNTSKYQASPEKSVNSRHPSPLGTNNDLADHVETVNPHNLSINKRNDSQLKKGNNFRG